jgi:hypothetical protein
LQPQQRPSSATANASSQQQQPQITQQLSSKQSVPHQQPEYQQQDSHTASQAAPVKRVGFSMDGVVVGATAHSEGGKQQNFTGVSRRKQEQLQREEQ